jgi:stage II sporulation protein D
MSQSAAIFGPENDIPPLAGNVPCDYCKIAPGETYRWGPVRLMKTEVRDRLVAAYPDLTVLGQVRSLQVTERTPSGRPVRLRIVGSDGASHDLLAERFRLAMGGRLLRSTDFTIRETSRALIFEKGRGFGHGLGLCQWGMQGQALQGKRAGEILRYYYPGARLARAY